MSAYGSIRDAYQSLPDGHPGRQDLGRAMKVAAGMDGVDTQTVLTDLGVLDPVQGPPAPPQEPVRVPKDRRK